MDQEALEALPLGVVALAHGRGSRHRPPAVLARVRREHSNTLSIAVESSNPFVTVKELGITHALRHDDRSSR